MLVSFSTCSDAVLITYDNLQNPIAKQCPDALGGHFINAQIHSIG